MLTFYNSYLKETSIGKLILFSLVLYYKSLDIIQIKYECAYWRIDNVIINPLLKSFLDKNWPMGKLNINTFQYPSVG